MRHEYEVAELERPGGEPVYLGHFYGDPVGAIIDADERWCAVYGCGLVLYFLEEPFGNHQEGSSANRIPFVGDALGLDATAASPGVQSLEVFRDHPSHRWINGAYASDNGNLRFVTDPYSESGAELFELHFGTWTVRRLVRTVDVDAGSKPS